MNCIVWIVIEIVPVIIVVVLGLIYILDVGYVRTRPVIFQSD